MPLSIWLPLAIYQATWCIAEAAFVARYRGKRSIDSSPGNSKLPLALGGASLLLVIIASIDRLYFSDHQASSPILFALGCGIGTLGLTFRLLAIRQLGPRFLDQIALLPDHPIESNGIYRLIKHPAEIGFCLAMIGYISLCHSAIGAILFLIAVLPLSLKRMRLENQMLDQECE